MKYNYFSQYKQDKFLNEVFFNNKKAGFYVDIGAHDGISLSNSLFFERYNNWEGICVEPNPLVFNKLILNRKSINLNVCIGNENKKVKFTQIQGYSEMLSGITENYDERHVQRINNSIYAKGGKKTEIEVEMITLDNINGLKNKKIDFISIDTEGNEYDIIKSFDFNLLEIKALVIENNFSNKNIANYLVDFGFELIYKLQCDDVYINKKYYSLRLRGRLIIWKLKSLMKRIENKLKLIK